MDESSDVSPIPVEAPKRTYGRSKQLAASVNGDTTADEVSSLIYSSAPSVRISPGKTLLDNFTKRSDFWLGTTRSTLREPESSPTPTEGGTDEVSAEELEATMLRLKKESISKGHQDLSSLPRPPDSRLLASTFGSSSLTELPTSTPPQLQSRKVSPPPISSAPASPLMDLKSSVPPSPAKPMRRKQRIIASDDEEDEHSEGSTTPKAHARPRSPVGQLAENGSGNEIRVSSRSPELLDLFDEGDTEEFPSVQRGARSLQPLSKADRETMQRDIARAARERHVLITRPEPKSRPVSQWMAKATEVISVSSQTTVTASPALTSDDIQQFTPSSGPNRRHSAFVAPTSSPTPGPSSDGAARAFLSREGDVDHVAISEDNRHSSKEDEKQKRLQALKAAALREKINRTSQDDDELSIIPNEAPKLAFTSRRGPDARAVLGRVSAAPAPTRQRQNIMRWSGKHGSKKEVTETHMNFAGQQFAHADLKNTNGGSRPVGVKKGRDETVSQSQVDQQMRARHQAQVRALAQTKEQQYGRARSLPEKETLDIAALVNSTASGGDASQSALSDGADSDYSPEDEFNDEDSGDETDMPEVAVINGSVPGDDLISNDGAGDENKENEPVPNSWADPTDADDDENPFRVAKSRNRRRVNFASDDEGEDTAHDTTLLQATSKPAASQPDLAAFDMDDGGFSQLFGETQAVGGAEEADAFAALRNQEELGGLLPTDALLPGVDISESQKRRDNALIGGDNDGSAGPTPQTAKKKQYLNSQGFFTQTRPAGRELTQTNSGELSVGDPELPSPEPSMGVTKSSSTLLNSGLASPNLSEEQSFRRLRRRDSPLATPSKGQTRNAFDALRAGAQELERKQNGKSFLVDEQAEESDEDDGWGLPVAKEDEGNEDLDGGYVPDLLDDADVDEEERAAQAALAAEKFREVVQEDDVRLEAEAKKVAEGHYRHKRRGNNFLSDEEDEDGKPRRLSKRQRRQRKLDREDGLYKLGNESNVFLTEYEADLLSDNEFEEAPASPSAMQSPGQTTRSVQARQEMLRTRARLNQLLPTRENENNNLLEESHYAIATKVRTAVIETAEDDDSLQISRHQHDVARSVARYSKYVSEEAFNPRRTGGTGGVSVVVAKSGSSSHQHSQSGEGPRAISRQSSSILLDRNKRFG